MEIKQLHPVNSEHVSKNILIRNLTAEQNERLLLLQKKFGVKTNSQAILLLLRYCVIAEDEIAILIELYNSFAIIAFEDMQLLAQSGAMQQSKRVQELVNRALKVISKMEYLQGVRNKK
jgi:hypothetical protein